MKDYGLVKSYARPEPIEITATSVFLATNIQTFEDSTETQPVTGFSYNLQEFTKDEYISKLIESSANLQQELIDTQIALCDIYETLDGGATL